MPKDYDEAIKELKTVVGTQVAARGGENEWPELLRKPSGGFFERMGDRARTMTTAARAAVISSGSDKRDAFLRVQTHVKTLVSVPIVNNFNQVADYLMGSGGNPIRITSDASSEITSQAYNETVLALIDVGEAMIEARKEKGKALEGEIPGIKEKVAQLKSTLSESAYNNYAQAKESKAPPLDQVTNPDKKALLESIDALRKNIQETMPPGQARHSCTKGLTELRNSIMKITDDELKDDYQFQNLVRIPAEQIIEDVYKSTNKDVDKNTQKNTALYKLTKNLFDVSAKTNNVYAKSGNERVLQSKLDSLEPFKPKESVSPAASR